MTIAQPTAGVVALSHEAYHAHPAVSRSAFVDFIDDRKLYKMRFIDGTAPKKVSDEMRFGTAFHRVVLEGSPVAHEFPRIPLEVLGKGGAKSTNAYRDFAAEHPGKVCCTDEELWQIDQMLLNLNNEPKAVEYLNAATHRERSIVWQNGLPFERRCRLDLEVPHVTLDLKTSRDARPEPFAKAIDDLFYHVQAHWYSDGVESLTGERKPFAFIVCQKTAPFTCAVYDLNDDFKRLATEIVHRNLDRLVRCYETDNWEPPTHGQVTTLGPPGYAYKRQQWEMD